MGRADCFSALFSFFCSLSLSHFIFFLPHLSTNHSFFHSGSLCSVLFFRASLLTRIFSLCLCACVCPERLRYGGAAEVTPAEPSPVGAVLPLQSPAPPSSSPPPPSSSSPPGAPRPTFHPVAGPPQQDSQLHHPASLSGFHFFHHHHHHQPPQGRPPDQTSSSGPGSALPAGMPLPVLLQPGPGPLSV